jgi:hypothetical protein
MGKPSIDGGFSVAMFEPTGGKPNQYFIIFSRGGFWGVLGGGFGGV